jgi:hypothetical protein
LALLFAAGCSDATWQVRIPTRKEPPLPAKAAILVKSDLALHTDPDTKSCILPVGHQDAYLQLSHPLVRFLVFQEAEVVDAESSAEADFLVTLNITNHRVKYIGRNRWFLPNIAVWFLTWIPSWWIPDETFAGELDIELTVRDMVLGENILHKTLSAIAVRNLGDFDRGWTPLAIVNNRFDEENYRKAGKHVDRELWPEIHEQLFTAIGTELPRELAKRGWQPRYTDRAIVLGIGETGCQEDAERVAAFLRDSAGLAPENIHVVKAQKGEPIRNPAGEMVLDPMATVWDRLREWKTLPFPERQRILFYFAGEGILQEDGTPALVTGCGLSGQLPIPRLLDSMKGFYPPTVVIDAGFNPAGGVRSAQAPWLPNLKALTDNLAPRQAVVIFAALPGKECLEDVGSQRGTCTGVFLMGLQGMADLDKNGKVSAQEMGGYIASQIKGYGRIFGIDTEPLIHLPQNPWFPLAVQEEEKKETGEKKASPPNDKKEDSPPGEKEGDSPPKEPRSG